MKIISFPPWKTVTYPGQKCYFIIWKILQYSCINQVVITKVSVLQYKANPACEFVTMKTGNHQDPGVSFLLAWKSVSLQSQKTES